MAVRGRAEDKNHNLLLTLYLS